MGKIKTLRYMIVIPFIDFWPLSIKDLIPLIISSIKYNIEVILRIISIKFKIPINWNGNIKVPLSFCSHVKTNGIPLIFRIRERSDDMYLLKPFYEKVQMEYFKPRKGEIVLDVGAHVGKYTCYSAILVGEKGKVISIEANPYNFSALLFNLKLNKITNTMALNIAASDKNGEEILVVPSDYGRSSIVRDLHNGLKKLKAISRRLDDVIDDLQLNRIHWLKVDVEGAEIKVLKGLGEKLKLVDKILIEVSNENDGEIISLLRMYKFNIKQITSDSTQKYYFCWK